MTNNKCGLKMLDLYFSKFEFLQNKDEQVQDFSTSFDINYSVNNNNKNRIKVEIDTNISDKNKSIVLNLQTVGIFEIEDCNIDDEMKKTLIESNTVAIMFPYIRSQISLLTAQPGMTPIVMPPLNINELIKSAKN